MKSFKNQIDKKIITFVICSNGYGHCKRSLKVLNEIYKINPEINFNIISNKSKLNFLKKGLNSKIYRLKFDTYLMENEPNWLDTSSLNYSNYLSWTDEFKTNKIILSSDLVISDNNLAPLLANKRTFLMGSFLWHDIIKDDYEEAKKIREFQKKIITDYKPEIIVLESMYMDFLLEKVIVSGVPWFTKRKVTKKEKIYNKILVTSGGTEQLDDIFLNLTERLATINSTKQIFLDTKLYKKFKISNSDEFLNVQLFDFTEECFIAIDIIICRPGIGILTDCVSYLIPLIAIYDNKNIEIIHNAKKVKSLGLGIAIKVKGNFIEEDQLQKINCFLDLNETHKMHHQNLLNQKINGHQDAAHKILNAIA